MLIVLMISLTGHPSRSEPCWPFQGYRVPFLHRVTDRLCYNESPENKQKMAITRQRVNVRFVAM